MNATEIRQLAARVLAGIAPEANLSTVADTEDLREALDLDSMDFLNFIIGLSQASGQAIPESDYPRLFTLSGLTSYLSGDPVRQEGGTSDLESRSRRSD